MAPRPSIDRLREVLLYEPETGLLRWHITLSNSAPAGTQAGTAAGGYVRIQIDGCLMRAHMIAWALTTGRWPQRIDHEDRDGLNNRWSNLREADRRQNRANSKATGKSRLKGAYFNKGRWQAQITEGGKTRYLGVFDTAEGAHAAYVAAARSAYGEFARAA